ncbi:unnamed protein product [Calicophoron daubneyi]|uniref:Leucine-rich repeat-containing protein 49 n=1 Tax=Calicophoron daubneyi TaxID=300641 RepID=A0AAV2TUC5_CALDB
METATPKKSFSVQNTPNTGGSQSDQSESSGSLLSTNRPAGCIFNNLSQLRGYRKLSCATLTVDDQITHMSNSAPTKCNSIRNNKSDSSDTWTLPHLNSGATSPTFIGRKPDHYLSMSDVSRRPRLGKMNSGSRYPGSRKSARGGSNAGRAVGDSNSLPVRQISRSSSRLSAPSPSYRARSPKTNSWSYTNKRSYSRNFVPQEIGLGLFLSKQTTLTQSMVYGSRLPDIEDMLMGSPGHTVGAVIGQRRSSNFGSYDSRIGEERLISVGEPSSGKVNLARFERMELTTVPQIKSEETCRLLSLQQNQITKIDHLYRMRQLLFLDLSHNRIGTLSGLDALLSLRILLIGQNHLKRIQGLDGLANLEILDLHQNNIRKIENVAHLNRLKLLNLASNRIVFVNGLSGMTSLTELNLRQNNIVQIEPLSNLPNLLWVFLSFNQIERWTQVSGLAGLSAMAQVTLDGNPIVMDPSYRRILPNSPDQLRKLSSKSLKLGLNKPNHTPLRYLGRLNTPISDRTELSRIPASARPHPSNDQYSAVGGSLSIASKASDEQNSRTDDDSKGLTEGSPSSEPVDSDQAHDPASNTLVAVSGTRAPILLKHIDRPSKPTRWNPGWKFSQSQVHLSALDGSVSHRPPENNHYASGEHALQGSSDSQNDLLPIAQQDNNQVNLEMSETSELDSLPRTAPTPPPGGSYCKREIMVMTEESESQMFVRANREKCLSWILKDRHHLLIEGVLNRSKARTNADQVIEGAGIGKLNVLLNDLVNFRVNERSTPCGMNKTGGLSNVTVLTVNYVNWRQFTEEIPRIRTILPAMKKLTLKNMGLTKITDPLKLIGLRYLEALNIDSGPGNPIVKQAGQFWRPFLVWTLKGVLELSQLDGQPVTFDEIIGAATMFRSLGKVLGARKNSFVKNPENTFDPQSPTGSSQAQTPTALMSPPDLSVSGPSGPKLLLTPPETHCDTVVNNWLNNSEARNTSVTPQLLRRSLSTGWTNEGSTHQQDANEESKQPFLGDELIADLVDANERVLVSESRQLLVHRFIEKSIQSIGHRLIRQARTLKAWPSILQRVVEHEVYQSVAGNSHPKTTDPES